MKNIENIKYNSEGLVPCVVVDDQTKAVLMVAYMNETALNLTIETGRVTFYSRSRSGIWVKGETSGNYLTLREMVIDCDGDTLLAYATPQGPTCHLGNSSCFETVVYEARLWKNENIIKTLSYVIHQRRLNPVEGSYTHYLLEKGIDKILKKVGEETAEIIIGAKNSTDEMIYETADLIYHLLVLFENQGVSFSKVFDALEERHQAQ